MAGEVALDERRLLGGIEAGGTKFVLAVGSSPQEILARHVIATAGPAETLRQAMAWLDRHGALSAIGIASFGPVVLDRKSPGWGSIGTTPKPDWSGFDFAGTLIRRFGVPIGFDTDVNAAALAEYASSAGAGSLAYVTVGTGIGGGLVLDGHLVHGAAHPEMGHFFPRKALEDKAFAGICPLHGDCLEGLVSGPAIAARWGAALSELPATHPGHGLVADYLAQLCHTLFAVTAVETVVLGGGVMKTPGLIDRVVARVTELDNGYLPGGARHRVVAPALGENSGIVGALMLAEQAYREGAVVR